MRPLSKKALDAEVLYREHRDVRKVANLLLVRVATVRRWLRTIQNRRACGDPLR